MTSAATEDIRGEQALVVEGLHGSIHDGEERWVLALPELYDRARQAASRGPGGEAAQPARSDWVVAAGVQE